MKEQIPVGMNRTGVQMSPFETSTMQAGMPASMTPATPGDDTALADMRSQYITDADAIGSVPVPATVQGAVAAGASMMLGNQPQLLLDKLGERLAFERTGTRLYDALITKFEATQDSTTSMTLADLQKIRQDEARHFSIVASAIEALGGDPTSQTPCADLVGVESMGLVQAVTDPRTTIAQSLHAILIGEMADNVGWEMLIALAEDQQQISLISDFSVALDEERAHLLQVRNWLEEATLGAVVSDGALVDDISDANPPQVH
ncbi:MAG TPA: ferritin-like domain-containing protein [Noviherbaspirillum sp.]|uniref:ferritin-like domain-containing protein n=1 Tax=Noviherbaspirillum sp. TaxID=1926288 RepID=UPI002B47137D|nr:ferritin-like domain-containing protein [Noviherbaspirillum sp.]HJV88006.1 ferritin-like domain-containing protein [Noviherbaspirillum sp.]